MLVAQIGGARPAGSENETRATIFGGYSYLRNNSNGFGGWEGQGTVNFNRYLGVTADVSGTSVTPFGFSALGFSAGTSQHLNNYLFGPTVTASLGRSAVFAHALFGAAHSSLGAGVGIPIIGGVSTSITSANAFAMAFGGGIDIGLTRHLAIRALQVDYLRTQFNATDALTTGLSSSLGNRQNSFRYSTGVVFRF
jgi:peptidoglycan-associated lipoprotein